MTEETNIDPAGDIDDTEDIAVAEDEAVEVIEEEVQALDVEPEQVIADEPIPEPMPEPEVVTQPQAIYQASQAVSGDDVDDVILANCVYKNVYARKSLTVHHLQRRLIELGYKDADADKDGWLGDETVASIKEFQADKGMDVTGSVDADTFIKIFEGDVHVRVVL
jgi:peptidoglycan hydrolase-like protein with peptidoglycan-binding domain